MRFRAISLAVLAAAAVSTGALAAIAAKDPKALILRKVDFAATASYDSSSGDDIGIQDALEAQGLEVDAAGYLGATYSKSKGLLQVSGVVWTPARIGEAKKAFAVATRQRDAFWKRSKEAKKTTVLPAYGDQQFARYDPAGREGIGVLELLVRRKAVVWLLNVRVERRPAVPTKAELLGQLRKYAAKQRRRVGTG